VGFSYDLSRKLAFKHVSIERRAEVRRVRNGKSRDRDAVHLNRSRSVPSLRCPYFADSEAVIEMESRGKSGIPERLSKAPQIADRKSSAYLKLRLLLLAPD
jgi:hypothetical protein